MASAPRRRGKERFITLASTTSTEQSGFFEQVIPIFREQTGIDVRVVAVGTGQAIQIGQRGDADALLVHDRQGEDKFVAEGHGLDRRDVMFNDLVVVGAKSDPAGVAGLKDAREAFRRLGEGKAPFVSRGDDSGTHRAELRQWQSAGVSRPAGAWYRETGQGMGPTLNVAAGLGGYTLADRATWANFKNRQDLAILVEGDPVLFNPYGSILVNPAKGPHIKAAERQSMARVADVRAGPRCDSLRKSRRRAALLSERHCSPQLKPALISGGRPRCSSTG